MEPINTRNPGHTVINIPEPPPSNNPPPTAYTPETHATSTLKALFERYRNEYSIMKHPVLYGCLRHRRYDTAITITSSTDPSQVNLLFQRLVDDGEYKKLFEALVENPSIADHKESRSFLIERLVNKKKFEIAVGVAKSYLFKDHYDVSCFSGISSFLDNGEFNKALDLAANYPMNVIIFGKIVDSLSKAEKLDMLDINRFLPIDLPDWTFASFLKALLEKGQRRQILEVAKQIPCNRWIFEPTPETLIRNFLSAKEFQMAVELAKIIPQKRWPKGITQIFFNEFVQANAFDEIVQIAKMIPSSDWNWNAMIPIEGLLKAGKFDMAFEVASIIPCAYWGNDISNALESASGNATHLKFWKTKFLNLSKKGMQMMDRLFAFFS